MATLIISQPDGSEISLDVAEQPLRIGRAAENDVQIKDDSVSGFHAEIHVAGGRHILRDLGSTNGVRVNGERVQEAPLTDGDLLRFGNIRASYTGVAPAVAAAPEPAAPAYSGTAGSEESGAAAGSAVTEASATENSTGQAMPTPAGFNAVPGAPIPSDTKVRGFGPKKSEKDPEKSIFVAVAVGVGIVALTAVFLSFTMR